MAELKHISQHGMNPGSRSQNKHSRLRYCDAPAAAERLLSPPSLLSHSVVYGGLKDDDGEKRVVMTGKSGGDRKRVVPRKVSCVFTRFGLSEYGNSDPVCSSLVIGGWSLVLYEPVDGLYGL
jgi:hypothetical protein